MGIILPINMGNITLEGDYPPYQRGEHLPREITTNNYHNVCMWNGTQNSRYRDLLVSHQYTIMTILLRNNFKIPF